MINRVEKFLDEYIEAGSDIITFHLEIDEDINEIITSKLKKGLKCGLAIKPEHLGKNPTIFKSIRSSNSYDCRTWFWWTSIHGKSDY